MRRSFMSMAASAAVALACPALPRAATVRAISGRVSCARLPARDAR